VASFRLGLATSTERSIQQKQNTPRNPRRICPDHDARLNQTRERQDKEGMVIIGDCGPSDTHGLAIAGDATTLVV
jgi:hypothetical protein